VWPDKSISESQPKRAWAWYCGITDYIPFTTPVPAKIDGTFLERIAKNHWSVGIRPLPQDVYDRILALAGTSEESLPLPNLATIAITETDQPLLLPRKRTANGAADLPTGRYSRNALPVGRRAEEIAHRFLLDNAERLGAKNIRWVAQEGSTPGWDLQYENPTGDTIAVEVKGTTGAAFASVDITSGEWKAAIARGNRYWLYLVADCTTTTPRIQRLQNPAQLIDDGGAQLLPVVFRFSALVRS
jgi:hypothetical protein